MSKILIKNGRILDPESQRDEVADILVEDDKIAQIGHIEAGDNMHTIDATGKLVTPGIIDLHVHLRDMDQAYKETIVSGTKAARKGGVTTVFTMPNTQPALDCREAIERYQELIKDARVETHIVGAITKGLSSSELSDIDEYKDLGITMISDDGFDIDDEALLESAYEKAKENDLILVTHPEVKEIGKGGVINEGKVSKELGVPGQPNEKEWKAVERGIKLALKTGARAHMTHISTKESVDLVRQAKKESNLITCDVTPHHFSLTEDEVLRVGSLAKVNPPLRTEEDRLALIEAIKDGTIDCIVTDHAPHAEAEKTDDLMTSAFGISQIETSVACTLTELHFKQGMNLMIVIGLMTTKPSKLVNLRQGRLKEGYPADITIIDLEKEVKFDRMSMVSMGKNSPYHGKKLKGWPIITLTKGNVFKY